MRRSPVVIGIVAGLVAGIAGGVLVASTTTDGRSTRAVPVNHHLPELRGTARSYSLGEDLPTGAIEQLATALGVHGPVETDAGGWVVREGNQLLRVQRAPGLPWFLSVLNGPCQIVPESEPLQTVPPGGPTDCPGEPGGGPTTTIDPEPAALNALAGAGLDSYYAVINRGGGRITVSPTVDGRPAAGLDWSATVAPMSSGGEISLITAASGFLAQPQPDGTYPLIGTSAALAKLRTAGPVLNVRLGLERVNDRLVPAYLFEVRGGVQVVRASQ